MKILIPVFGSRGDVQLYINLAAKLIESGYEVTIATHGFWKKTIESLGINFIQLGPDINVDVEAAKFRQSYNIFSALKMLNLLHLSSSKLILEILKEYDLLIVTHMLCGAMEAISMNKPYVSVTFLPSMIQSSDYTIKTFFVSLLHSIYFNFGPWGKIKRKLKLKQITQFRQLQSPILNLIPFSKHVFPSSSKWTENNALTGFWTLPSNSSKEMPDYVHDFLQKYKDPIIVTLGAMSFDTGAEIKTVNTIINAISKSGNSGIIHGFSNTIKKMKLPDNIIQIEYFTSDFFKHGKIIIHHCGFGTMNTALYSGKPSIPIPHILDQSFWADRLFELDLCPKPFSIKKLTEQNLLSSIKVCEDDSTIKENTIRIMKMLQEEDGLVIAKTKIEEFIQH